MLDGNITVVIQGRKRFKIEEMMQDVPYFKAKATELKEVVIKKEMNFSSMSSVWIYH